MGNLLKVLAQQHLAAWWTLNLLVASLTVILW